MDISDLIYINCNYKTSIVITSGISFHEFIEAIEKKPKNILIIDDASYGVNRDKRTNCDYCLGEEVITFS